MKRPDPWIPRAYSLRPVGKRRRLCRLKWVSRLIDSDRIEWKEEKLEQYFSQHDVLEILLIRQTIIMDY